LNSNRIGIQLLFFIIGSKSDFFGVNYYAIIIFLNPENSGIWCMQSLDSGLRKKMTGIFHATY